MSQGVGHPELLRELLQALLVQGDVYLHRHFRLRHLVPRPPYFPERPPAPFLQQAVTVLDQHVFL